MANRLTWLIEPRQQIGQPLFLMGSGNVWGRITWNTRADLAMSFDTEALALAFIGTNSDLVAVEHLFTDGPPHAD
jgi:hypothetical protein